MTDERAVILVKKWLIPGSSAIWTVLVLKVLLLRFWVLREINSRFCSKTRHVGAHLGGHQHGVSIQISINLGKTFLRISSIRKIAVTWILARVFAYLRSFYFQIMDLIYWTVLIFILIYFEWLDTENQQLANWWRHTLNQMLIKYGEKMISQLIWITNVWFFAVRFC